MLVLVICVYPERTVGKHFKPKPPLGPRGPPGRLWSDQGRRVVGPPINGLNDEGRRMVHPPPHSLNDDGRRMVRPRPPKLNDDGRRVVRDFPMKGVIPKADCPPGIWINC